MSGGKTLDAWVELIWAQAHKRLTFWPHLENVGGQNASLQARIAALEPLASQAMDLREKLAAASATLDSVREERDRLRARLIEADSAPVATGARRKRK